MDYRAYLIQDALVKTASPNFKTFKKHQKPLTPEERKECMDAEAVWHFNGKDKPSPAVHKAVIKGKTWYECHTHRAVNFAPTLRGAIKRFHDFIKGTA